MHFRLLILSRLLVLFIALCSSTVFAQSQVSKWFTRWGAEKPVEFYDAGQVDGLSERQVVDISNASGTTTFTLSFNGQTTAAILASADANTVRIALEGLSSIGSGNVNVTKSVFGTTARFVMYFTGSLTNVDVPQMTGAIVATPGQFNSGTVFEPADDRPMLNWSVIPLDIQDGVDLSTDIIPSGVSPWYSIAAGNGQLQQKAHAWAYKNGSHWNLRYYPYQYPIAAFGSGSGSSPMYVGQSYRFALVAGSQSSAITNYNDIIIHIYNKQTGAYVGQTLVQIPNVPAATFGENATEWEAFAQAGYQKRVLSKHGSTDVLETTVQFVPTGVDWEKWGAPSSIFYNVTTYPLFLTHRALSDEYGFIVSYKSQLLIGEGESIPYTVDRNQNYYHTYNAAHGYAYAIDFENPQPWHSTLVHTPHFNGKALPPSYHGKTAEEIEQEAIHPEFQFGDFFEGIRWKDHVNTSSSGGGSGGTDLTKIAPGIAGTWDASARSEKVIYGDGIVQCRFRAGVTTTFALGPVPGSQTHGILANGNQVSIVYNGSLVSSVPASSYTENDVYTIQRVGLLVRFYKNGEPIYTSPNITDGKLYVNVSAQSLGTFIQGCRYMGAVNPDRDNDGMEDKWELAFVNASSTDDIDSIEDFSPGGDFDNDGVTNLRELLDGTNPNDKFSRAQSVVWTSHVNTISDGVEGGLKKIMGVDGYNADAVSIQQIDGDGQVSFQGVPGSFLVLGLNDNNLNRSATELDYAILFHPGGAIEVFESGVSKKNLGTWNASTIASIERVGTVIRYWKDGSLAYISTIPSKGKLCVDTAFYTVNSAISNARITNGDLDGDGMLDTWELAYLGANVTLTDLQNFLPNDDLDDDGASNLQEFLDGTAANDPFDRMEAVVWTNHRNSQSVGTNGGLRKTSGSAEWSADAVSTKKILADGAVEYVPGQTTAHIVVGLTYVNDNASHTDLEYSFYAVGSNGTAVIREDGISMVTVGNFSANSKLKIERKGDTVRYYLDRDLVYTSTKKSTGPLLVDCSIHAVNTSFSQCRYNTGNVDNDDLPDAWELAQLPAGASISDLVNFAASGDLDNDGRSNLQEYLDGTNPASALSKAEVVVWTSHNNTASQGIEGGLQKTAGGTAWNGGAVSEKKVLANGRVTFKIATGSNLVVGFNAVQENHDRLEIDYGWHPLNTGALSVYENGTVTSFGTWNSNTVLAIERTGDTVRYLKDGVVVYVSSTKTTVPLFVDTSFNAVNNAIVEAYYVTGDLDGDGMSDEWELALLGANATFTDLQNFLGGGDLDNDGVSNLLEYEDGTFANNPFSRMEAVVWMNHRGTLSEGVNGGLRKITGASGWNADAVSSKQILADGAVQYVPGQANQSLYVGLTYVNNNATDTDFEFAFQARNDGNAYVYESGTLIASVGRYAATSRLRIERVGSSIRYYLDGKLVHTSAKQSVGPLWVDCSIHAVNTSFSQCRYNTGNVDNDELPDAWELAQLPAGASISDLVNFAASGDLDNDGRSNLQEYLDGTNPSNSLSKAEVVVWTSHVNAFSQGSEGGLQKTTEWNGGAVSDKRILGDGKLTFKAVAGSHLALGLNTVNLNNTWEDLDYAWHPQNTGTLGIYENGSFITNVGTWNENTVLTIERVGDTIRYWKDGLMVYVSATKSTVALLVDAALWTNLSTVAEASYVTGDLDGDGMLDEWELALLGPNATFADLQNFTAGGDLDNDGASNLQEFLEGTNPNNVESKFEPVVWIRENGTQESAGGRLIKISAPTAEGDPGLSHAGAVGEKVILGDGRMKFRFELPNANALFGFSVNDRSTTVDDIEYGIYARSDNNIRIYESGADRGAFGTYLLTDEFEVRRNGSVISYWKNNVRFYTSSVPSISGLVPDASIPGAVGAGASSCRIQGASFADATNQGLTNGWLEPVNWVNLNGATKGAAGSLWRSGNPSAAGDATLQFSGGVSQKLMPGSGRLWFRFAQSNLNISVGLSKDETDRVSTKRTDLDYSIAGDSAGKLRIFESGVDIGEFGTYTVEDILEIRRDISSGEVSYWKNNICFHTSTTLAITTLFADAAIGDLNATLAECRMDGAASDNAALDQLVLLERSTNELLTLNNSPELRTHPILDEFVQDMGRNPMALANFVINEIGLTDALGYNERGEFDEASVNAGGLNRGALATFQERQGSPAEQCALLVYLLRRAGYPTAYVFPETNSMKLLDVTLSKMLRMQVKGALNADGTTDVPHEIPVNYPWVAVNIDGEWVHLFPWIKDTEIKEGLNFWQYMPAGIDNPMAWIQKYIKRDASVYDSQAESESPAETLVRKFQDHLHANHPGKDLSDFGFTAVDRKHNYSQWKDFPRPWSIDAEKTPLAIVNLNQRPGMFDTVEFQFRGINGSGVKTDLQKVGPLRLLDLHNRRTIFSSNANNLVINTQAFHSGHTGTGNYLTTGDLLQAQQISLSAPSNTYGGFEVQITTKRHRYVNGTPIGETFLGVSQFSEQQTLNINRHDLNAWCLNAGRVTPQMLRVHAEESWANNLAASPDAAKARNILAYTMGMSYYQRTAASWETISQLFKLRHISTRAFGFGTFGAKHVGGGNYEQGYPILDMAFVRNVSAGGGELRPDAGGQNKNVADWFTAFAIAEISAQEHLTINRFFPEEKANAISTLELLRRTPVANIVELTPQNYDSLGNTSYIFNGTSKTLKDWAGPQWTRVQQAFSSSNIDRDFTRIYMTPGPVNGAENSNGVAEWNGMGTLIVSRTSGGALIGQSLNGAFAKYFQFAATAVKVVNTVLNFSSVGNLYATYRDAPTAALPQYIQAATTFRNLIASVPLISSYAALVDPIRLQSYHQSLFNKAVGSVNISQLQTIAGLVNNFGSYLKGIVNEGINLISDPVNVLTGEFYHDAVDLTLSGGMPLQIRRNYGSRNTTKSDFGYGWKSSMMPYLLVDETGAIIYAAEMDGNVVSYSRVGSTDRWIVKWEDNPELLNTENGRLHHNVIDRTVVGGKTYYRLKAHDGSLREYEVRSFPVTSGSTTVQRQRPYLNRWYDHAGNYYEFSYYNTPGTSDYGMLRRIASSSGSFIGFYYNVSGCITEAYASDGRRVHYHYNNYGDLTEVVRPDGSKELYEYALVDEAVPNSSPARTEKISTHLLIKETKPEGRVIINEYERDASNPAKFAESRRVLRQFSNVGKPNTGTPVDQPVSAANANDPVEESYLPRLSARFNYANLVTNTTTKLSTGYVEVFDAYDRKTEYHFDNNKLTQVVDPLGYTTTTEYYPDSDTQTDPGGYRRSIKRTIDQRGLITAYEYDARGNPSKTTVTGDLDGNPNTIESAVSTTQYNIRNLPEQVVAPDPITGTATGRTTTITYGNTLYPYLPTQTTVTLGTTVITKTVNSYGEVGAGIVPFAKGVTMGTSSGVDGDMSSVSWSYDRSGLPTQQIAYSGVTDGTAPNVVTRFRYNERKELLESEDAAGRKTRYAYDNMGRRIWEERLDSAGKQVGWNYVYYNQNGEVEWTDGPRFAPEDYTYARYDGMGRVVEEVLWRSRAKADGTGVEEVPGPELYATTKKAYSLFGDLIKTTDPNGNTTRVRYDAAGRPVETHAYQGDWQNGGSVLASTFTTYHHELDSNNIKRDKSVSVISPTGGITRTYHTQAGAPWRQENPDGTVLEWEYYLDGRPKKEPLSPHTYVLYTYDDAARQVIKTTKNALGDTLGQPQVATANSRGQLISATDAAGNQVTSTYDKLGRVRQVTQPHAPGTPNPTLAIGHIYDAAGVVATSYNALNEKTVTTHDALGRPIVSQVLDSNDDLVSQVTTDYEPTLPGQTTKIKGQNAVQTTSGVGNEAIKSSVMFTDTTGAAVLEVKQVGGYVRTEYDMLANLTRTYTRGNLDSVNGVDSTLTSSSFDGLGRPLVTTMPDGAKVSMFYDYVRDGGNNIVGSIVERRMPGAALSAAQGSAVGGLVEYQKFDAAGRLKEKSLKSGSSSTRNYVYHYHPANVGKDGGLLHSFEQQVGASVSRQHVYTYDNWRRPDTYTVGTSGQSDYVKRTFAYDDPRSLVTSLREDTVAGYTIVSREYDEQGRIDDEKINVDGATVRHLTNGYNAAGRRDTLAIGNAVPRLGNAAGGAYSFSWLANGQLKTVTAAGQNFNYGYQTNGLISSRTNAWRGYNVTSRDARGRVTSTTTQVAGVTGTVLAEGLTWLDDDRQASYTAQRGALPSDAIAAWTDGRAYNYDLGRRRLHNEILSRPQGGTSQLVYSYDQGHAGLGVRTMAVQGPVTTSDFQSLVDASDSGATNAFARIVREKMNHQVSDFDAQGTSLGAYSVSLALEHANSESSRVAVSPVSHPGPLDNQGAWRAPMRLWPGNYTLHASAQHPSGTFTANSQTTFLLQREMLNVNNAYDEEGNTISRIWSAGSTTVRTQNLIWDGQGRLIHVLDRDLNGHGYDWNARYDGLGRRIGTTTQTIRANVAYGAVFEEGSWYDPLVEFLEIAVETRQMGVTNSERRTWKVHGPDANGSYGGLHGVGGLEALVEESDGTKTALIDDYYGHIIANVEVATLTTRWSVTRSQSYGPTPDSPTYALSSGASLVHTLAWQGRRVDVTGYYSMGARYYDATGGRFLSPDPLSHAASMDLYSFAGGDPVNFVDPTGRIQKVYNDAANRAPQIPSNKSWFQTNISDPFKNWTNSIINSAKKAPDYTNDWQNSVSQLMGMGEGAGKMVINEVESISSIGRMFTPGGQALKPLDDWAFGKAYGFYDYLRESVNEYDWFKDDAYNNGKPLGEGYQVVVSAMLPVGKGSGKLLSNIDNLVTTGANKGRGLWKLTTEGADKVMSHGRFGTFYRSSSDGLWWAADNAGHGGSAFKVFRETGKGLEWFRDADQFGDFIVGKHKGATGQFIPWKELKGR